MTRSAHGIRTLHERAAAGVVEALITDYVSRHPATSYPEAVRIVKHRLADAVAARRAVVDTMTTTGRTAYRVIAHPERTDA